MRISESITSPNFYRHCQELVDKCWWYQKEVSSSPSLILNRSLSILDCMEKCCSTRSDVFSPKLSRISSTKFHFFCNFHQCPVFLHAVNVRLLLVVHKVTGWFHHSVQRWKDVLPYSLMRYDHATWNTEEIGSLPERCFNPCSQILFPYVIRKMLPVAVIGGLTTKEYLRYLQMCLCTLNTLPVSIVLRQVPFLRIFLELPSGHIGFMIPIR